MGLAIGQIVVGLVEALFGRKLYWIFVALGGFSVGWGLVSWIFGDLDTWIWVLAGAVVGILLAFLSLKFTKWVVSIAGFFALGAVTVEVVRWFGGGAADGSSWYWVAYLVGGFIGFILARLFFDWALIFLTALLGAGATATGINHFVPGEPKWLQVVLWFVVFAGGTYYQVRNFRGKKRRARSR